MWQLKYMIWLFLNHAIILDTSQVIKRYLLLPFFWLFKEMQHFSRILHPQQTHAIGSQTFDNIFFPA